MARILVVGGAGYVGSATCAWLLDQGHTVWVLDDLSTGHRELVLSKGFTLARAGDRGQVSAVLRSMPFDCVMHFAARSLVAESVEKPAEYFENNVDQTRSLLDTMLDSGVRRFVFSSTAAVFGNPGDNDIGEDFPKKPINPYGETKLAAEKLLAEYASRGLKSIALRYFNAAGAEPRTRVGEWHTLETHLIPRIFDAVLREQSVRVFGTDYPTPDGTCVRDYIHVTDLAKAHEAAMLKLLGDRASSGKFDSYNLGSEKGFSVLEVIRQVEEVIGRTIPIDLSPRRPGDPPRLVAASQKARKELGFTITPDSLRLIISSAWNWELKRRASRPAVFLDRDGTINEDPGYLSHPDQMKLLPGVGEALASMKEAGFLLVVVSNQSGVGRGLIAPEMLPAIHERLADCLAPYGVRIDDFELCFHRPEDGCPCRKPSPKLIIDSARRLNVDLARSVMIGDKVSDLEAGRRAQVGAVALVRSGEGRQAESSLSGNDSAYDYCGDTLLDVARWLKGLPKAQN